VTSGHTVVNKSARPVNWVGSAATRRAAWFSRGGAAHRYNPWYEETRCGDRLLTPLLTILFLSYCPVMSLIYIFAYVFVTITVYTRVLRCLELVIFWNQVVAKSEGVRPPLQKMGGPDLQSPLKLRLCVYYLKMRSRNSQPFSRN